MTDFPIHGFVAPGFEAARDAFERNFTDDIEVGASFCVMRGGETLVDLWGGYQDQACTRPWQEDTLVNVYSTTKGVASAVVATIVDEGKLDYDAPVKNYWPEFYAAKDGLTVGQFLSHQSGVCGLRETITVNDLYDWSKITRMMAAEEPHWEPGKGAGYHAILWGYLAGELALRTTGKSLGQLLAERIAGPLGADFYIGLPTSEHGRVSDMIGPNRARIQPDPATLLGVKMPKLYSYALENPVIRPFKDVCSPEWRSAEIAAANGQANARGIARIYDMLGNGGSLDGHTYLGSESIAAMVQEEWGMEEDLVLGRPMRRGRGINLNTEEQYGPNPNTFGHNGAGGSIGFADPERGIGIGYAMNQMSPGTEIDPRGAGLVQAIMAAL